MTSTGAQLHSAMQLNATQRYEMLRAAAFGAALPPEARSGLTILLHRGVWAWVRTILQAPSQCRPAVVTAGGLPIAHEASERRTVIYLLAAMAMAAPERRKTA